VSAKRILEFLLRRCAVIGDLVVAFAFIWLLLCSSWVSPRRLVEFLLRCFAFLGALWVPLAVRPGLEAPLGTIRILVFFSLVVGSRLAAQFRDALVGVSWLLVRRTYTITVVCCIKWADKIWSNFVQFLRCVCVVKTISFGVGSALIHV